MMELQQAALDIRTHEHSRRVDDANRNGWLRPVPRRVNSSVQSSRVLGAVSSRIASTISVGRKMGLTERLAGSVTSESALGTA